jgi:predicted dehydrogenase/threonine dehydrogenase-like Zn-dependent dehydrogenase
MKQIIQNLKNGETILTEVPAPAIKKGHILIQTRKSLVSLGTERMLVEFGKANLIEKARQQPDKVRQVFDKIKTDGLIPTYEAVINKLDQPMPLGYCNAGEIIALGDGVTGFKVGDRVASNGSHAEFVCIPKNLVVPIPDNVTDDEATFTVIGSIGLQGIRLLNPTFDETIVVVGLGLIGLVTAQLLKANGCRVIGLDFDQAKIDIAKAKGIKAVNLSDGIDPVNFVESLTNGIGVDGVIITASNQSNEIISQAARMCRKRGRIILIGVIGLQLTRSEFYEKELSFQVSCSYGPGRYDENYEQRGQDYPIGFVRWTEQRNFQAILNAISVGILDVKSLISDVIDLVNYEKIYKNMGSSKSIASILSYPENSVYKQTILLKQINGSKNNGRIAIIGAGNFTKATILPCLSKTNTKVLSIVSANGVSGTMLAKKYDIPYSTTNFSEAINDPNIDLVMITTRHNLHASMVIEALKADKHVFVEKPLAINQTELDTIIDTYKAHPNLLMVGFNRRFSPHAQKIKTLLGDSPMNIIATMNAGFIPQNMWVHDPHIGGGRIIGEACHYIDFLIYLTGSLVKSVCMTAMGTSPSETTDNATILLKFENGSTGVINYFANGNKSYAKERFEVYSQEKTLILDNFRKLQGFGFKNFSSLNTTLNKGHQEQFNQLSNSLLNGKPSPININQIFNTTQTVLSALKSLKDKKWVEI